MNKNIKPTILVTGSEGNIGTYVVKNLCFKYPQAAIVGVSLEKGVNDFNHNFHLYKGDLRDGKFVDRIFKENKIDYVIHLAARLYGVAGFNKYVYDILSNDLKCLLNVLDKSKDVKDFVYFSSSMIYESSDRAPFNEELAEEIMPPKSSYGLTKFLGEKAVKFFSQQYGIDYTIWRPFNVVSPLEDHRREGGHVFVDLYRKIFVERNQKIEIYGSGKQVRCFTWVEDVAQGIVEFLFSDKTKREVFNIGSSEPKTVIELANMLIKIGKEKNILPSDYNPEIITGSRSFGVDVQLRIPDVSKIKRRLGWECKTDFKACFEKFIDYKQYYATKK